VTRTVCVKVLITKAYLVYAMGAIAIKVSTHAKGERRMKVSIDRDGCISCGLCISLCPDVFYMADDNRAMPSKDLVPDELKDCVAEAADSCPVSVIHTEE